MNASWFDTYANTPWGRPDQVEFLADGIAMVSTPRHGGIVLRDDIAEKLPVPTRLPNFLGSHTYWEEDGDATYPMAFFGVQPRHASKADMLYYLIGTYPARGSYLPHMKSHQALMEELIRLSEFNKQYSSLQADAYRSLPEPIRINFCSQASNARKVICDRMCWIAEEITGTKMKTYRETGE